MPTFGGIMIAKLLKVSAAAIARSHGLSRLFSRVLPAALLLAAAVPLLTGCFLGQLGFYFLNIPQEDPVAPERLIFSSNEVYAGGGWTYLVVQSPTLGQVLARKTPGGQLQIVKVAGGQ
jgi:hypothetical protein